MRTVYLPLKGPDWGEYVGVKVAEEDRDLGPVRGFACKDCHGVIMFTRAALTWAWNQLVLHYTGGLMYGREVERPAWLVEGRRHRYAKRPRKAGAPRREMVERLLRETEMSYEEIGREMGTKRMTVAKEAMVIYRMRGVGGREELRRRVMSDE